MKRLAIAMLLLASPAWAQVTYPIVYVRAPRPTDRAGRIPEAHDPVDCEPGTDLVLLNPDGTEEVLVEAGANGCVFDPRPSINGQSVFYAYTPNATRSGESLVSGADIFRLDMATRQTTQLTHQEWEPNVWVTTRVQPTFNFAPCPLPNGRVAFVTNRQDFIPVKGQTWPNFQLAIMDDDGKNQEITGHLNLGSALHPTLLKDGRLMWSSYESQGHRAATLWALWEIRPDGRRWGPIDSNLSYDDVGKASHWQAQWSDGDIALCKYYNGGNGGFGTMFGFPIVPPAGQSAFGNPVRTLNTAMADVDGNRWPFQRAGIWPITPWATSKDIRWAAGKVAMPSGAPNNTLLFCYTPGPANLTGTPYFDSGIYLLTGKTTAAGIGDGMTLIKNDPAYNELQPVPLVPWATIYGSDPPLLEADPSSEPFGYVGSSTFYRRETASVNPGWAWIAQGSGPEFDSALIDKVRIIAQEPSTYMGGAVDRTARGFYAVGVERLRVLGEISLRKPGVVDINGDPDTSFLAKIPADTSFTFQTVGTDGMALNMSQTWHQVRPGEWMTDRCAGCHLHHDADHKAVPFATTAAGQAGFVPADLTQGGYWTREFFRDVLPIFQARCQPCHAGATPDAGLRLDDTFADFGTWATPTAFAYSARTSSIVTRPLGGHPAGMPADEIKTIAQWIDLGMQKSLPGKPNNALADDSKPTLTIGSPKRRQTTVTEIKFGDFDYWSGVASRSAKLNFATNGRPAGAELFDLFTTANHQHTLALSAPFTGTGQLTVSSTDLAGNKKQIVRDFVATEAPPPPPPPPDCEARLAAMTAERDALLVKLNAAKAKAAELELKVAELKALLQ